MIWIHTTSSQHFSIVWNCNMRNTILKLSLKASFVLDCLTIPNTNQWIDTFLPCYYYIVFNIKTYDIICMFKNKFLSILDMVKDNTYSRCVIYNLSLWWELKIISCVITSIPINILQINVDIWWVRMRWIFYIFFWFIFADSF